MSACASSNSEDQVLTPLVIQEFWKKKGGHSYTGIMEVPYKDSTGDILESPIKGLFKETPTQGDPNIDPNIL